ncbi:hypothetical protein CBOM_03522 [Ceraceosorus bombacis]|uniref:Uncharacterized protein n=1 Tax=Ceraceosorus bombacis TaxID=401625 RepID=A0A0P1BHV7_9BASI|nr:hypothetical protein CBOM_03522 [Ceraceosorus bombacis]
MAYTNAINTAMKPMEGKISMLFEHRQDNKVIVGGCKKDLCGVHSKMSQLSKATSIIKKDFANAIDTAMKPMEGKISTLFEQGQDNKVIVGGRKKDLCGVRSKMSQLSKATSIIKKDFANAINTAMKPMEGKISALFEQGKQAKVSIDGLKTNIATLFAQALL